MQHEFQPEENQTPLTAKPTAPLATETEADAQAARLVTERLDEITVRARRARRRAKFTYLVTFGILTTGILFAPILYGSHKLLFIRLMLLSDAAAMITFCLGCLLLLQASPKFDAVEIANLCGTRAIQPLFVALGNIIIPKQRRSIYEALILLLPQLKASDAHLLTDGSRRVINHWLSITRDDTTLNAHPDALRIAALKALEQVGDSSAIPVVERLAEMWPPLPDRRELHQAARDCLPMLRANCGEVEAARTLLRASHAEAARPDTLLRPASGAGQTAAQELLRPSDEESGP